MQLTPPRFEIVTTKTGAVSIRNNEVNEIMHNPVGPWAEANAVYIDQSNLRAHLALDSDDSLDDELVVFDVGLGAAANAIATLSCAQSMGASRRRLRLVSFERDLELLKFALEHASAFEHFAGFELALKSILEKGSWVSDRIIWELRHGDFKELIDHEPNFAHLVFFDPYSPKMNQDMWGTSCFTKLRAKCRDEKLGGTSLYTYTLSTRVRVSMILAGFFVGHGKATGLKDETTEASTVLKTLPAPLSEAWLSRWQRSHARHPFDCQPEDEARADEQVAAYLKNIVERTL